ncbi:MAG: type II toxin-antitoxin system HicB family antitoxin [Lactococcus garvieae]
MTYLKHRKAVYPIVISKTGDQNNNYHVTIPDLKREFDCKELVECIDMARDFLENPFYNHEILFDSDGEPYTGGAIEPYSTKFEYNSTDTVTLVDVDLELFTDVTPTKKTLTIPKYLNELALDKKINFSKFLAENLAKELKVPYKSSSFFDLPTNKNKD